ncbi:MAG TPA: hypothetical protein VGK73_31425 [Polyangiaceae bacterium]
MSEPWIFESTDIAGVGRAPTIEYHWSEDNAYFEASPPGGHIRVEAKADNGKVARILLTNALTGEVFAGIDSRHTPAPSVGEDWNDAHVTACEIASALYWSMWRMQQVKAAKSEEPKP